MSKILGTYVNGNTIVVMREDGTKERYIRDGEKAAPEFPESMDLKITNRCDMNCAMCFPAGTKILMADYTYKNIEDVKVGDRVIAFEETVEKRGNKRRIEIADVLQTFVHVESELIEVETFGGNHIVSTPNHPFLTQGVHKNHSREFSPIERINVGQPLYAYGFPMDEIDYQSMAYAIGYSVGSWAGDGTICHRIDKNGYDAFNCRFVTLDDEINDRVYEMISKLSNDFSRAAFKMNKHEDTPKSSVVGRKRVAYEFLTNLIKEHIGINNTKEYCAGYLAGFCDSEGHVDNQRGIIRLTNTNVDYLHECERALDILGIDHIFESHTRPKGWDNWKPVFDVRIIGDYGVTKFLWYARPVCKRKSLENFLTFSTQYHTDPIISKAIVNKKQYVYNFETTSHTYIANNFMVHNCAEQSTPDGEHADLRHPIFNTINPYTELAIGGGNPLEHPDLVWFLLKMQRRKVICNLTINVVHFMRDDTQYKLKLLTEQGAIHGLGISVPDQIPDGFLDTVKQYPNAVIHTIAGVTPPLVFDQLADHSLNLLILGYKAKGKGYQCFIANEQMILDRIYGLEQRLPWLKKHFKAVAFDNLAVGQLNLRKNLPGEDYDKLYMGDDGEFTMYIDMVEKRYGESSSHYLRPIDFEMAPAIADLFQELKKYK